MQGLMRPSRHRAFSQEALRRLEEVSSGRQASTVKPSISKALELDGRSYLLPTLTLSKVLTTEVKVFQARANRRTPVVLDLQQVSSDGSPHSQSIKKHELRNEILQIQKAGYVPVGITNASEDVKKVAAALDLPYFIGTRLHLQQQAVVAAAGGMLATEGISLASNEVAFEKEEKAVAPVSTPAAEQEPPMIVSHSVRSGQQIFAQNRSLVVLGNVSSGAEVLADEDVIVLGTLKGRALAGIGGNGRARIVCQSFDAELVSIAHCFTTCDDLEQVEMGLLQLHKPTAISLQNDRLHFESSTA